ncbi:TolC family protein [Pedobacter sp. L105]|uniref:TolC family protein n=1 Tax=Pedobacter sp. L105 TaxID=1641871 RepID=UPI001C208F74|nr:TolC family protein [Pedobacter sp. L105]
MILYLSICSSWAQTGQSFALEDIISLAKRESLSSKIAKSTKFNLYYQYLSYQAGNKPLLSLTGNLLNFNKNYSPVTQPDGTVVFLPVTQNYANFGLAFSEPIQSTGGTVSINSGLQRFDDFGLKSKQYSGIPLNVSLEQPFLAFNEYKWKKKIEPLKLQEAEKQYIKDTESISLQATKDYFDVLDAQANLELAKKNLESQKIIYEIENKRVSLGTTTKDKILQIKLQLLNSQQELESAKVNIKTALSSLVNYSGLADSVKIHLLVPEKLPKLSITAEKAIEEAKKNRAEFISYLRRKLESQRDLDQAKKDRYNVKLIAAYGLSGVGETLGLFYNQTRAQANVTFTLAIPIIDWGRTKQKINIATSNLETVNYTIAQEEIELKHEITNLVDNLQLVSNNISITQQADTIAEERYELTQEQFRFGKTTVTELNIALNEKDTAKRSYISALRNFWESYYQLRVLTLYNL